MTTKQNALKEHRLTLRLQEDEYNKLAYWADHEGYSINEFVPILLQQYTDISQGNYPLQTLEQQRLNQLIETVTVLSRNVQTLESVTTKGFDSLLGLTRGDNYLLEQTETGEI